MGPFQDGWTISDVEAVLAKGDPEELLYVPILVSLSSPDSQWSERLCVQLAAHPHWNVRANALLGFSHLARCGVRLDEAVSRPILKVALHDPDPYIRGRAEDVRDDLEHYLGWELGA